MLPGQTHGELVAVVGPIVVRSRDRKKFALLDRHTDRLLWVVRGKKQAFERAKEIEIDDEDPGGDGGGDLPVAS